MKDIETSHWIDGRFPPPPPKVAAAILCGFILLVGSIILLIGSTLGDRIPLLLTILGGFLGFFLGFWCVAGIVEEHDEVIGVRKGLGFFVLPIFCIVCGTFLMRSAFLGLAFVGIESSAKMTKAIVVGGQRKGRVWESDYLDAKLDDDSREFRVRASRQLVGIANIRPGNPKTCVLLPVQTGRWGYRRIIGPTAFDEPVGVNAVVECD